MAVINGFIPDWGSIEINLNGRRYEAREVNYQVTVERAAVHGAGGKKLGLTRGTVDYEADVTLYIQEAVEFLRDLGNGFAERAFDISVSYTLPGGQVVTDRLVGCRVKGIENGHSQGNDPLTRKFTLDVMEIKFDEKSPFKG